MSAARGGWSSPPPRPTGRTAIPGSRRELGVLIGVAVLSIAVWQLPYGHLIVYPFTILATWFHEMGHGLAALLVGGDFQRLVLYTDGSGLAYHTLPRGAVGGVRSAMVAAGGPLGPAVAGAFLILVSPYPAPSRWILGLLGAAMIAAAALWISGAFGLAAIGGLGLVLLWVAVKGSDGVTHFLVNLLGVQACISTYRQIDYLFTRDVVIDGSPMLSDTGRIAETLVFPHWFWAGAIIAVSAVLLAWSLRSAFRGAGR